MYRRYQGSGRPVEAFSGPIYSTAGERPEEFLDLGDAIGKILREQLGKHGIYSTDDLKDASKAALKKLVTSARDNLPEDVKRALFTSICVEALRLLPHPTHPAVLLFLRFLAVKEEAILHVNTSETVIKYANLYDERYVTDILNMPEVKQAFAEVKHKPGTGDTVKKIVRDLEAEGEAEYIKSLVRDLYGNCTRALLGGFTGYIKFFANKNPYAAHISIRNELNWVSATRFPPSWGGYSVETGQTHGASFCAHVEGWSTRMQFDIFVK